MIRFTIGGKDFDLLLEDRTGQVSQWVDRYRPKVDTTVFCHESFDRYMQRGDNVLYPNWPYPTQEIEYNRLYVPSGASRWSCMACLCTREQVAEISKAAIQPGNYRSGTLTISSQVGDRGERPIVLSNVYALPPQPLSFDARDYVGSITSDGKSLYVLPLVDERYWWQHKPAGEVSAEEWDTLGDAVDYLCTQLGISPVITNPNDNHVIAAADLPQPAPALASSGNDDVSAATLLDAATSPLGMLLTPNLQEAGYYLLDAFTSYRVYTYRCQYNELPNSNSPVGTVLTFGSDSSMYVVAGGHHGSEGFSAWPNPQGSQDGCWPENLKVQYLDGSSETVPFHPSESSYVTGTERVIRVPVDEADSDYTESVRQAAVYCTGANYDWTFAGARQIQLASLDDVLIVSFARRPDGRYDAYTRLRSLPHNYSPEINTAGGGSSSGSLILGMVSCYLGNGWYDVYKVDLEPPKIAAEDVLDETTGQTRIVQLHAGRTTWLLDDKDTNQWTNESSDGYGTSQTPNVGDYEGIENGDRVVTENQLTAEQNMGLCVPLCYASTCTWTWTQDGGGVGVDDWVVSPTNNCENEAGGDDPNSPGSYVHGGCDCQKPAGNGTEYGETKVTACAASDCSTETPPEATWTWKLDPPTNHFGTYTPYWELTTDCGDAGGDDASCRAVEPNIDTSGLGDGATSTVQCYPSGLCSWVTENYDPPDPCCLIDDLSVDPDLIPRQKPYTNPAVNVSPNTYGDPVRAFAIDKMTMPGSFDLTVNPGTYCFMMPLKTGQFAPNDEVASESHWAIVQWQRELIGAYIPTAITCCDDGSILISAYSSMIVEGIPCAGSTETC